MTRLCWNWLEMRPNWSKKTQILNIGWLLKLPKSLGNCPKSQWVLSGASDWPKWVQIELEWTWGVNYPLLRVWTVSVGLEVQNYQLALFGTVGKRQKILLWMNQMTWNWTWMDLRGHFTLLWGSEPCWMDLRSKRFACLKSGLRVKKVDIEWL